MTALISTGIPKSSGVLLTQNTASVLDFRCLYTHDLRQKKKRWHDGVLRFHTFNRRIMVYDVSRNFIGDKYWREPEAIQDGVELELEKGVLIQVEEAMGKTEQDLTPILNHHKTTSSHHWTAPSQSASVNPARAHVTSTAVSTAASTAVSRDGAILLKPKSLNTLLGTPKGKYGRAVLPQKSLFQSRHETRSCFVSTDSGPERVERPAKRLKTTRDKVNGSTDRSLGQIAPQITNILRPKETETRKKKSQQAHINADKRANAGSTNSPVINLDTDTENAEVSSIRSASPKSKRLPRDRPSQLRKVAKEACNATSQVGQQPSAESYQNGQHKTRKKSQEMPIPPREILQNDNLPPEDNSLPTTRERSPPPYILRFAASKPRRKLMYRDLLPDQPPSTTKGTCRTISNNQQKSPSRDSLSTFEQAQQQCVEDRIRRRPCLLQRNDLQDDHLNRNDRLLSKEPQTPVIETFDNTTSIEDHSGEVKRLTGSHNSPPRLEDTLDLNEIDMDGNDDIDINRATTLHPSIEAAKPAFNTTKPMSSTISSIPLRQNHSSPGSNHRLEPSDTTPSISTSTKELIGLAKLQQMPPLKDNTVPISSHASYVTKRSPIKKSQSENNTLSTKANATSLPTLKKQISDTSGTRNARSALHAIRDRALGPTAAVAPVVVREDDVTGPWSREAFDLFGWRPGDSKFIGQEQVSRTGA